MEYMQLSLDDYIQCKNDIKNNLGTIVKSFVRIGWQLSRIDKSGAYKNDGYNSIAEFAKAEYGMSATGTSRFIRVYEKYSVPGDTPELRDEYKDYNRSQLEEMLQIPEEDHEMIRPEAHKEDIRELNRFNKENESSPDNLLDWKNAQTTEEKIQATIYEFWHDNRETMNTFFGSDMEMKDLAELLSPSGSRSYRKGTVFLMFYNLDTEILVKVFGDDPVKMTYQEFADRTRQIFEGAAVLGRLASVKLLSPTKSNRQNSSRSRKTRYRDRTESRITRNICQHRKLRRRKKQKSRNTTSSSRKSTGKQRRSSRSRKTRRRWNICHPMNQRRLNSSEWHQHIMMKSFPEE